MRGTHRVAGVAWLAVSWLAACGDSPITRTGQISFDDPDRGQGTGGSHDTGGAGGQAPAMNVPVALTSRVHHTCALFRDGQVKCWGENESGQLGLGDEQRRGPDLSLMGDALPVVDLGSGVRAVTVAAGGAHTCALLASQQVKCWGYGFWGQIGLGTDFGRGGKPGEMGDSLPAVDLGSGAKVVHLAVGTIHTCAVLATGAVKCWGNNDHGQLGLGDTLSRGAASTQMGDALPAIDLGAGARAVAVAAGSLHTCALLESGQVKCWGYNQNGMLGLGDGDNRGDEPGEMGDALPAVDLGASARVVSLTAGSEHTCARFEDGTVKCWGNNLSGELGLGDTFTRGDSPGDMGSALPPVALGGAALSVAAQHNFGCAVITGGRVKCWGSGYAGQLGLGNTKTRGALPGEMGDALPSVDLGTGERATSVVTGGSHACALLTTGAVKCWGSNVFGLLGLGDTQNRGDDPGETGDALPAVDLGHLPSE